MLGCGASSIDNNRYYVYNKQQRHKAALPRQTTMALVEHETRLVDVPALVAELGVDCGIIGVDIT